MARRTKSNVRPNKGRYLAAIKRAGIAVDQAKQRLEPGLDRILAITAANVGTVYAASVLIDRSDLSGPSNAFIMMATGATLTAGNYLALRNRETNRFRNMIGTVNRGIDSFWPTSWAKTITLATVIGISCCNLYPYAQQMVDDFVPMADKLEFTDNQGIIIEEPAEQTSPDRQGRRRKSPQGRTGLEGIVSKSRPAVYDLLSHEHKVVYDFSYAKLAPPETKTGRVQRTLRWQPIYRAVEKRYGLPEGTLAGMIMQESMGDPVMPNAGGDGGLGLVHFQCTTAGEWGLKTYGKCKGTVDRAHGAAVKELIRKEKQVAASIQAYDERAHIIKVLDAAARLVSYHGHRLGGLDLGIEAFGPGAPGSNRAWRYLHAVKQNRKAIRDPMVLRLADDDFRRRTGKDFGTYLRQFHETANNWGFDRYIKAMHR